MTVIKNSISKSMAFSGVTRMFPLVDIDSIKQTSTGSAGKTKRVGIV